jgi:hypothetical protein
MELLNKIQKELNAPKNLKNAFGGYNYRSAEGILDALKPLLGNGTIICSDEIVLIGSRYYVKATATLTEGKEFAFSVAFAREAENRKGMDESQVTGSASSYARKYALNGLFAIDDTKDADSADNTKIEAVKPKFEIKPGKVALSSTQLAKSLQRIEAGEIGVIDKMQEFFTITPSQLDQLQEMEAFTHRLDHEK